MADTKISAMTVASSVVAADIFPLVQSGANKSSTLTVLSAGVKLLPGGAGTAALPGLTVGATTVGLFSGGTGATEYLGLVANGVATLRVDAVGLRLQLGVSVAASDLLHVVGGAGGDILRCSSSLQTVGIKGAPISGYSLTLYPSSNTHLLMANGAGSASLTATSAGLLSIDPIGSAPQVKINGPAASVLSALNVTQNDDDEPFVDYNGTTAASAAKSLSSWTAGNTIQGFVRVAINGADFWMPYYNAPTS